MRQKIAKEGVEVDDWDPGNEPLESSSGKMKQE